MVSNITLVGWDYNLNKRLAEEISKKLSMYFLSFSDLIAYNACDKTKEQILAEGGEQLFTKYLHNSAGAVSEFCDSVIAIDAAYLDGYVKEKLLGCSTVVFINQSKTALTLKGIDVQSNQTAYSRQRFCGFYNIFVDAVKRNDKEILEDIFSGIKVFYDGGENDEV